MKTLQQFINEALKPEEMFITSITGVKLTKDNIVSMLDNMDLKDIKKISDKLAADYSDEYFAYEPGKDMFLKHSEKSNIISKMADFCIKFIVK